MLIFVWRHLKGSISCWLVITYGFWIATLCASLALPLSSSSKDSLKGKESPISNLPSILLISLFLSSGLGSRIVSMSLFRDRTCIFWVLLWENCSTSSISSSFKLEC